MMFPAGISTSGTNPGFPFGINPQIARVVVECITIALLTQSSIVAFAAVQSAVAFAPMPAAEMAFAMGSSAVAFAALSSALSFATDLVEVNFNGTDTCPIP